MVIPALLGISMIFSCNDPLLDQGTLEHEKMSTEKSSKQSEVAQGDLLILGERFENPFSVKNMNIALQTLRDHENEDERISEALKDAPTNVEKTHSYRKFSPSNDTHLELMLQMVDNAEVTVSAYPMDHQIIQFGEDYTDSDTTNENYPVFYASIPTHIDIPNIPNQEITELYLPKGESAFETLLEDMSRYLVNDPSILEAMELGSEKLSIFGAILKLLGLTKYTPKGNIQVYDTDKIGYVPFKNAQLSISFTMFPFIKYTFKTDQNGNYVSPKNFRIKTYVHSTWRNQSATMRTTTIQVIGLHVSTYFVDLYSKYNNKTTYINTSDRSKWNKCTTHLGFEKFNDYLDEHDITTKVSNANVWVFAKPSNSGAAPMLNKYTWSVTMNTLYTSWFGWLSPVSVPLTAILNLTLSHLYPDLIFNYNSVDTKVIDSYVFHESAHYIHALKAGGGFWSRLVRRETDNIVASGDPYLDGTQPSTYGGQLIALAEGYANYMEAKIISHVYTPAAPHNDPEAVAMDNFIMKDTPYANGIDFNSMANPTGYQGWFLAGLFWDISDDSSDPTRRHASGGTTDINDPNSDNVYVTEKDIFNLLNGQVESGTDLKNALYAKNFLFAKPNDVKELFEAYGY